jgi:CRP-like cAMP-binding protein
MQNQEQVTYWSLLHEFLQRFINLSEEEFNQWRQYFEIREFNKKTILVDKGEVEDYVNIVAQGLVRKYMKVKKGDVTIQIAPEGHMVHSERSFHQRQPSEVIVETIEPSVLISISYDNLENLYKTFPLAEKLGRLFATEMFIIKDKRFFDILKKSTREIFLDYIKTHPQMLQRVPQKFIASYLNIKPETFSRLKHLLKKKI